MAIQWFPGHMNKARKKISEAMPEIDLVLEVLDARLPYSSSNPLVDELRGDKPVIRLLNKSDLADPETTRLWCDYLGTGDNVRVMPLVAEERRQIKQLTQLIRQIGEAKLEKKRAVRVMIMGIPNVGKSTLINSLAGRQLAKTGNEPAVTKANQMVDLKNGIVLSDTPGILWPKIGNPLSGYRLAASGAVRDTAMEYTDVAHFALSYLLECYPKGLSERFKLKALPESGVEALDEIGRRRGCLRPGGVIDRHKAAELVLHEMRSGKMGRISLETPDMVQAEEQAIAEEAARAAEENSDGSPANTSDKA